MSCHMLNLLIPGLYPCLVCELLLFLFAKLESHSRIWTLVSCTGVAGQPRHMSELVPMLASALPAADALDAACSWFAM